MCHDKTITADTQQTTDITYVNNITQNATQDNKYIDNSYENALQA